MKAEVLNQNGNKQTMIMGCYRIGVARINKLNKQHNVRTPRLDVPTEVGLGVPTETESAVSKKTESAVPTEAELLDLDTCVAVISDRIQQETQA